MHTPEILTVMQAAEMLGCEPCTLEERLAQGEFPGVKYGRGGWRIPATAMHQHLTAEAMKNVGRKQPAGEVKAVGVPVRKAAGRRAPPQLATL